MEQEIKPQGAMIIDLMQALKEATAPKKRCTQKPGEEQAEFVWGRPCTCSVGSDNMDIIPCAACLEDEQEEFICTCRGDHECEAHRV